MKTQTVQRNTSNHPPQPAQLNNQTPYCRLPLPCSEERALGKGVGGLGAPQALNPKPSIVLPLSHSEGVHQGKDEGGGRGVGEPALRAGNAPQAPSNPKSGSVRRTFVGAADPSTSTHLWGEGLQSLVSPTPAAQYPTHPRPQ